MWKTVIKSVTKKQGLELFSSSFLAIV